MGLFISNFQKISNHTILIDLISGCDFGYLYKFICKNMPYECLIRFDTIKSENITIYIITRNLKY